MSDRLCLTADLMGSCPVWGLEQRLITAERVREQRDNAMAQVERLRQDLSDSTAQLILDDDVILSLRQEVAGLENTILGLRRELTHTWTRTEEQRVRLTLQREALKAAVRKMNQYLDAEEYQHCNTLAWAETEERQVERLRGMIQYALAGPDEDLPEPLGGRAVACVKKVLRDAIAIERGWLKRELQEIEAEVEGWPLWMKEAE